MNSSKLTKVDFAGSLLAIFETGVTRGPRFRIVVVSLLRFSSAPLALCNNSRSWTGPPYLWSYLKQDVDHDDEEGEGEIEEEPDVNGRDAC